jgi:hypothetical protein
LEEIRRKFGVLTSFLVSDATRKYYHFSGITRTISKKDSADAWYFRVHSMKKDHEINVDLNPEQSNVLIIFVNKKVCNYDRQFWQRLAKAGTSAR